MLKLINSVQHYAWGSKTALTDYYGIDNPSHQPMAELWMGAHPKGSSRVLMNGKQKILLELIEENKNEQLGPSVAERFGALPFLFKVLCAEQPLSIQVHPGKMAAEKGFRRENALGISLQAAERNYKDANHKPELVYAISPFLAVNAFRDYSEISSLLRPVTEAHPAILLFLNSPNSESLSTLFGSLLSMTGELKLRALSVLKAVSYQKQNEQPWQMINVIAEYYPEDPGLFSLLLLNVIELKPGEAMFLPAETPHAYLKGIALEIMANSDNVLRAGLTPKHIDIPELLANIKFEPRSYEKLLTQPEWEGNTLNFSVPVDDFSFSVHSLQGTPTTLSQQSAAILFCIEGNALIFNGEKSLSLEPGESCFIAANEFPINISGTGKLARAFNTTPNTKD